MVRKTSESREGDTAIKFDLRYLHFKKVFSFQFKYFNNTNKPKMDEPSAADLTKPDGNLELNIGKINIVFLYRFITELWVSVSYFE